VKSHTHQQLTTPICGYLEGYYGKLLSWGERKDLLNFLTAQGMTTYCYAPKEDTQHRLHWRDSHSPQWHESFAEFSQLANKLEVSTVAGIAPGLDFDFNSFNFDSNDIKSDFNRLLKKSTEFLDDGANEILILWDDIDDCGYTEANGLSEGAAHARVINKLSDIIGRPLWTVPRVYAAEIDNKNQYREDFFAELQPQHTVLLCGNAVVARRVELEDLITLSCSAGTLKHRTVVWDNFYANDYCPRRLFIGPWVGRDQIRDYLLNPTGLPFTDQLLLDVAHSTHTSVDRHNNWVQTLSRHGVPDAFQAIADYFTEPFFGDRTVLSDDRDTNCIEPSKEVEQAIEECLWKWKSPLAREWYPFIFGLKHDLALMQNTFPRDRVLKTQSTALAKRLLSTQ